MENLFNDERRNQVPYRATRTFPTSNSSQTAERRFEPSWTRSPPESSHSSTSPNPLKHTGLSEILYSRDQITHVIGSIENSPPPQNLQLCKMIVSEDQAFASKLLDKSYYFPKPSELDHVSYASRSYPKTSDSRFIPGIGRGRGYNSRLGPSSLESEPKWSLASRGPFNRSRLSSDKTDLSSSFPHERVVSGNSRGQSVSEAEPASPLKSPTDWQYFPGEEMNDLNEPQSTVQDGKNVEFDKATANHSSSSADSDLNEFGFQTNETILHGKVNDDAFKDKTDVIHEGSEKQVSKISDSQSEKQVSQLWNQNRESQSYTFLNPSAFPHSNQPHLSFPDRVDYNADKGTNSISDSDNDISNSNIPFPPQDPRHLWYYIDPKGNVQGPFLSEYMDGWYNRQYFPPTLPVWRECDSEAFKLSNLLNITDYCSEPFSAGAEKLLISRDFSPVEDLVPSLQNEKSYEEPDPCPAPNLSSRYLDSGELSEEFQNVNLGSNSPEWNYENDEVNKNSNTEDDEGFKVSLLSSSPEDRSQQTFSKYSEHIENSKTEVIPPQPPINMWLQGPPKIPRQMSNGTDNDSTQLAHNNATKTDGLDLFASDNAHDSADTSQIEVKSAVQSNSQPLKEITEEKPKRKTVSPLCDKGDNVNKGDSKAGWTKVVMTKKQKKKSKKESDSTPIQIPSDIPGVNPPNGELSSSPNIKLDELDSFSMRKGKRSQNIKIPLQPKEIVDFSEILSEQRREERTDRVSYKQESPTQLADFLSEKQLSASKSKSSDSAWSFANIEYLPSFLSIESEQKKDLKANESLVERTRFIESQMLQQQQPGSWAKITKSNEESTPITTKRSSGRNVSTIPVKSAVLPSPTDDVFMPTHQDIGQTNPPAIASKSKQHSSNNDSEHTFKPDGIKLSKACYDWVTGEISYLNRNLDPPTTVHLLQGFSSLFEITQLGSELLGTSERTNVLCRRIWEDLNTGKKQKNSQADDWVKVAKKPAKSSNRKKPKSLKSPVD